MTFHALFLRKERHKKYVDGVVETDKLWGATFLDVMQQKERVRLAFTLAITDATTTEAHALHERDILEVMPYCRRICSLSKTY